MMYNFFLNKARSGKLECSNKAGKTGKQHQSAANLFFLRVFSLLPVLRRARSGQECRLSWCYVWYMGRSEPKDNVPTIFTSPWMSAAGCRGAPTLLRSLDHQRAEHRSTLCLSCWPRPNYAAQEMKRGRRSLPGSRQGLWWLGGLRWRPFPLRPPPASPRSPWAPSSPLASGQWAILGPLEGPVQSFNPWPDLLSGGGGWFLWSREVGGAAHVCWLYGGSPRNGLTTF